MASRVNLKMRRGDTGRWDLALKDQTGAPLNLVGATLRFTAKRSLEDLDAAAVIRLDSAGLGGILVTDAGNGLARISAPPASTSGLTTEVGLWYDVQITEADGSVTTVLEGSLTVFPDITQAV